MTSGDCLALQDHIRTVREDVERLYRRLAAVCEAEGHPECDCSLHVAVGTAREAMAEADKEALFLDDDVADDDDPDDDDPDHVGNYEQTFSAYNFARPPVDAGEAPAEVGIVLACGPSHRTDCARYDDYAYSVYGLAASAPCSCPAAEDEGDTVTQGECDRALTYWAGQLATLAVPGDERAPWPTVAGFQASTLAGWHPLTGGRPVSSD